VCVCVCVCVQRLGNVRILTGSAPTTSSVCWRLPSATAGRTAGMVPTSSSPTVVRIHLLSLSVRLSVCPSVCLFLRFIRQDTIRNGKPYIHRTKNKNSKISNRKWNKNQIMLRRNDPVMSQWVSPEVGNECGKNSYSRFKAVSERVKELWMIGQK